MVAGRFLGLVEVYWNDNKVVSGNGGDKLGGFPILVENRPVWPKGFIAKLSQEVKNFVLKNAGARPWDRDDIDKRIIQQVENGTNRVIHSEQEVGGYPEIKPVFRKFNKVEWDLEKMIKK